MWMLRSLPRSLHFELPCCLNVLYKKCLCPPFRINNQVSLKKSQLFSNICKDHILLFMSGHFKQSEWDYLLTVIDTFGFGNKRTVLIHLLCFSSQTSVCTNSIRLPFFIILKRTCQGWPLFPLPFTTDIKWLSIVLLASLLLQDVRGGGVKHCVTLYADDLLEHLTDPGSCTSKMMSLLENFDSFSGYKSNFNDSEYFLMKEKALQIQQTLIPFRLSCSGFKYLGVQITCSLSSFYTTNFIPLLNQMNF